MERGVPDAVVLTVVIKMAHTHIPTCTILAVHILRLDRTHLLLQITPSQFMAMAQPTIPQASEQVAHIPPLFISEKGAA